MAYNPNRSVVWQTTFGDGPLQVPYETMPLPRAVGELSERVYVDLQYVTTGAVVLAVAPSDGVALDGVSIGAHTELTVMSTDGAHSLTLYMADAVPLTVSGGTLQTVAFGGSYSPFGDSTGLAYDADLQHITVSAARLWMVRACLSLVAT